VGPRLPRGGARVELHADVWTPFPTWEIGGDGRQQAFAARAQTTWLREAADQLQRLSEAGWRLADPQMPRAYLPLATAEAAERAINEPALPYGYVLDVALPSEGSEAFKAGGLVVGIEPHPALYPPDPFPAIVVNTITGGQALGANEAATRPAVAAALRSIVPAAKRPSDGASLTGLGATELAPTLDAIADRVESGTGAVPSWIDFEVEDDFLHLLNGTVEVVPRRRCVVEGARVGAERIVGYTAGQSRGRHRSATNNPRATDDETLVSHAIREGIALAEVLLAEYGR
jgi:hypothetical protein